LEKNKRKICSNKGVFQHPASLLIVHDKEDVEKLATNVININYGRLLA
jgi:ABC-type sulfate/molybdate transport systems ATPase subunit